MKKADAQAQKAGAASAAPAPAEIPPPATETTPEQLTELKARAAKADEHWDRLLRTAADFENFKKRAARERHEAAQSATAALVHKLLPVLDHFEMAQAAAQNAPAPQSGAAALQDGITMIQQQLKGILAETGLEEVDASGQPFDPTLHEAVSQLETADTPEGHVVQQIRKGYKLRDRLLRPATVVVAKKPTPPPAA
ncbi:MAG TPA: nucleotide exchange factor GrpE [Candidatus Sulfopaludibacter sp.]|nr:nucleotide exchange factor GrpE [Candidatus Sulfopaludibacter sp.]